MENLSAWALWIISAAVGLGPGRSAQETKFSSDNGVQTDRRHCRNDSLGSMNRRLVANHLKHGMMTVRPEGTFGTMQDHGGRADAHCASYVADGVAMEANPHRDLRCQ